MSQDRSVAGQSLKDPIVPDPTPNNPIIQTIDPTRLVRRALDAAADALTEHGWRLGAIGRPGFGFCAVGAINHVVLGETVPRGMGCRSLGNHSTLAWETDLAAKHALAAHLLDVLPGSRPAHRQEFAKNPVRCRWCGAGEIRSWAYDRWIVRWNDRGGRTGPEIVSTLLSVSDRAVADAAARQYTASSGLGKAGRRQLPLRKTFAGVGA